MARQLTLVIIAATVLGTGCATVPMSEATDQAHQRWDRMRGRVQLQLAEQEFRAGLFDDAAKTALESIALDPTSPGPYVVAVMAQLERGKPASAQELLAEADRMEVASTELSYLTGVLLEQRGELADALALYRRARTLQPKSVDYLVAEAECLVALGRSAEALALLDESVDGVDERGTVHALAAHIAALNHSTKEALRRYGKAVAAGANDRVIAEEMGRLLVEAHRWEEALAVLEPLDVESDDAGTNGAVRKALAKCHLALGDGLSAKRLLKDFALRHPADAPAQLLLAKASLAAGDIVTALRAIDAARQYAPDWPEVWFVRAAIHWKRGSFPSAASDLFDVLANDPRDIEAHCLLAEVLGAQKHIEAAKEHFHRALELDPECAWAAAGLKALTRADATVPSSAESRLTAAPIDTASTRP